MNTKDILNNIQYLKVLNEQNLTINNIQIDTRKVKENDLYIGIKGEKYDGNSFYMDALNNGASIAILEKVKENDQLSEYLVANHKTIIIVEDTIKTLGDLARYKRSLFTKPVVAITGSAGKTSTKDMVYSVLKEGFNAHKTIGNQNNHIGLPLTILGMDPNKDILVVEMGMNHLGEISYLTNIAKPDVAIITNVGTAHIGNLGSRNNILKAKLEIIEGLNPNGTLIINHDNDLLRKWYLENKDKMNIKTFGFKKDADYKATDIQMSEEQVCFNCQNHHICVPIGAEHFIYNALASLVIGLHFNLDIDQIQKGISNFELSRNRMNIIKDRKKNITIIDDCYNSNFDSLSYSIKYLGSLRGRQIAVLGSMLELGEYSEELHKNIGDLIIEEGIDILITVGDYTKLINERAIELGFNPENSYHYNNNKDAITKINELKTAKDVILVKASLALNFKEIVEAIK